jgi:DNA polymerase I-like protein with 3'-5' exonuclease and polymerase domains
MIPVGLDFETYYDNEYSLSRMTVEEYVRDSRFEAIMLNVQLPDREYHVVGPAEVERFCKWFDWSNALVVGQNTAFDGFILSDRYGARAGRYADTLGMSRALFPHEASHSLDAQVKRAGFEEAKGTEVLAAKGMRFQNFTQTELNQYSTYCRKDVRLTLRLFHRYLAMGFPLDELKLIDLTLRMFIDPVLRLDVDLLRDHLRFTIDRKQQLMQRVKQSILGECDDAERVAAAFSGDDAVRALLMSNDKFAQLLQDFGVDPPTKVSARTGKVAWAFAKTDEAFQELQEHPDPDVQALVAARLGIKTTIEETRTQRFIGMAARGAFPVPLRYYGAHSGRWSGEQSINLQNLPARGPNAGRIKKAILAPEGYVIVDCDSAQIEARVLAWLARQDDLIEDFRLKKDVYSKMASRIYGREIDRKRKVVVDGVETLPDATEGQVGKTVVLGCGFGVGHAKLKPFLKTQAGVDVPLEEAKRIIDTYRHSVPKIVALWKACQQALMQMTLGRSGTIDPAGVLRYDPDGIILPNGMRISYPGLRAVAKEGGGHEFIYTSKGKPVRIYGGKVVENVVQALARIVVAHQMLLIARRYRVVLTVHDAVACLVPESEAAEGRAFVERCMSVTPKWATDLPISCESGVGKSYGDC